MNYMTMNIHDVESLIVEYTPTVLESGTSIRNIVIKAGDTHLTIVLVSETADATAPRTEKWETWE